MGIISEVVPTFAGKPLFGAASMIYAGIAIGFLSFGVWSHHMFAVGLGPVADTAFSIITMLIAIPTGIKIFNWILTLWGGRIRFSTPLYFALGFISMFTLGGLSGVMHSSPPVDLQQTDSYFVVAHLHYVLFGGSVFALFAGAYYWWPKAFGTMLDERLGRLHFWLMFIGFNVTFFPMHFLGLLGMPRRIYTYAPNLGWSALNFLATVGAFVLASSLLVFVANVARTIRHGSRAESDPWDGRSLEWSTTSPPPPWNFDRLPRVQGRDDFWWRKHGDGPQGRRPEPAAVRGERIHMPPPSFWPILVAASLLVTLAGFLVGLAQVLIGGLLTIGAGRATPPPHEAHSHEPRSRSGILPKRPSRRGIGRLGCSACRLQENEL